MDWVDALHETPDLCGEIEVLDFRAIFIGRYSCVYKGRMKRTDELVAIKVLNPIRGIGLSTMRRKIERERKTWSSLWHPNILPLYGFADDHRLFTPFGAFISPWRAHGDLGEFLIEEGEEASLKVRLHLWQGVVAGVDYLHSHQPLLVHGDLKPGNVLINDEGHAQLCDFGLVRIYLKDGHSGMTTASPHCGTERYLAWELVMAGEDAIPTAASDIYATGCIGLETLFLQKPYSRHVTNVRWHMMIDMHAGNPPAIRPSNLVGQVDSLWEILSWCWGRDPLFRPHARVLCTQVANVSSMLGFEDGEAPHRPVTGQPSGPQNHHDRITRGSSPAQSSEGKQSGNILVYDPDISKFVTAIPSSNGSYDHLSDLDAAVNVGIRGGGRAKQGSESNIDLGCTDIEEECSSAAYDDGTSLSTSAPIVEAPGMIRGKPILSDTRLRGTIKIPAPSDPGIYRPRSIVAENAMEELLKFASAGPEILQRMHDPPRWDSMPVWDSHSQLKDRGVRNAALEKIKAVAPVQSYPFIDAGEPLSNHLTIPPKIEDVVFSSKHHFGLDMNTPTTNVYPVASPGTKTLPLNSLAAYRYPNSGMVPSLNQDYVKRPTGPRDYGLSSAQSSTNTDVAKVPSVILNPSGLCRESGAEVSNPVSPSQPDFLPRGSRASLQRRPLPKPPGPDVVESMSPLALIPKLDHLTLSEEGYPSGQSESEMGRRSQQFSGRPSLRSPATTYVLPAYRRSGMSRNFSKPPSTPTSTSISHILASTAPTSGSLDSAMIMERPYGTLDEVPDSDAQASTRGGLFTNPRSRAKTYSSSELAVGVLNEPSKPATRRILSPTSLQLIGSGGIEDYSFMGTTSPASPTIPASSRSETPSMLHLSTSASSRVAYPPSSPIAIEKSVNPQLPPASTVPPLRPPRNPARLHATAIGPKTGESNYTMDEQHQQQRGGSFSLLRPKRFSTMWRSRPKSLLSPPLSSETPPTLEASPSARRSKFDLPFSSRHSKEKAKSGASIEAHIDALDALEVGGHRAMGYPLFPTLGVSTVKGRVSPAGFTAIASGKCATYPIITPFSENTETPPLHRPSMRFGDPSVHIRTTSKAKGELQWETFSGDYACSSSLGGPRATGTRPWCDREEDSKMHDVRMHDPESADDMFEKSAGARLEGRGIPSGRFFYGSADAESFRPTGVQSWDDASISTVCRDDADISIPWCAGREDSDDGVGVAWLKKRKQQRERELDETRAQGCQAIPPGRSATSPRYSMQPQQQQSLRETLPVHGTRSTSPGMSSDLPDPQRKEGVDYWENSRDAAHVNTVLSPIQVVDQNGRKEACTVCHITIRAQNMERHKRSRHPKHFA